MYSFSGILKGFRVDEGLFLSLLLSRVSGG